MPSPYPSGVPLPSGVNKDGDKTMVIDSGSYLYHAAQKIAAVGVENFLIANPPAPPYVFHRNTPGL